MVFKYKHVLAVLAFLTTPASAQLCCGTVTSEGARLTKFLDESGVDRLWLPHFRVHWDTGEIISQPYDNRTHSHCSAFVASMAKRLGFYILRPPEHKAVLLASAQMVWLNGDDAVAQGWHAVKSVQAAQSSANSGQFVAAVFESPLPNRPGHIAIIRPSTIALDDLLAAGPFVTQAGGHNALSVPLVRGFGNHRSAWIPGGGGEVRFFAHTIDWSKQ